MCTYHVILYIGSILIFLNVLLFIELISPVYEEVFESLHVMIRYILKWLSMYTKQCIDHLDTYESTKRLKHVIIRNGK